MKRYIVEGNVTDTRNVVGFAGERLFVDLADLQAWALKLKKVVEGMDHDPRCLSSVPLSAPMGESRFSKCNCKRGEALRLLREVTNG